MVACAGGGGSPAWWDRVGRRAPRARQGGAGALGAVLAALSMLGACDREGVDPPVQTADVGVEDVGLAAGCTACGETACCGENLSCEPVDFTPTCVCGAEPACGGDDVCFPWEDGVLRCTVLLPHGGDDCTTLPRRCADGTLCIAYEKHGTEATRCHTACSVEAVLCGDGALCIALLGKSDEGVCNVGGTGTFKSSCTTHAQCEPTLFCVDQRCERPCRRSAPQCPAGQTCQSLQGDSHAGVCD